MTQPQSRKWQNDDAGPRQVKDLLNAISALHGEGTVRDRKTGVIGGPEQTLAYMIPTDPPRPEVTALDEEIREKHGHAVTRKTVRAIIAEYKAALESARKSRPVDDARRTPAEDAELRAQSAARAAAEKAERDARAELLARVRAKAPAGARALIFAEYHEDTSDPHSDYSGSRVTRTVAIGFRSSAREDFRALRAAAAKFPETAHMASQAAFTAWLGSSPAAARAKLEFRENYSLGSGNYLSDHFSARSGTGWVVRSREFPCQYLTLTEDAIPAFPAPSGPLPGPGAVTVSPSSTGREDTVEIRFGEKPPEETRAELIARGFRRACRARCWYGPDKAYAEALAARAGQEPGTPALQEDRHLARDR